MDVSTLITSSALGLILIKWLAELWLSLLNRRHVQAHADTVPVAFKDMVDESTYVKSVSYTLARNRLSQFTDTYGTLIVLVVLFSGALPWAFEWTGQRVGTSAWSMAVFLFAVGMLMALPSLPVGWVEQFRLEQRFGFNTSTHLSTGLTFTGFLASFSHNIPAR